MEQRIILLVLCLFAVLSCHRDTLYYKQEELAQVRLNIDWSKAQLNPNGISIYVFNERTGAAYGKCITSDNPDKYDLHLPIGLYRIIVVNDTDEEMENVEFRGTDNLSTFRAVVCISESSVFKTQKLFEGESPLFATDCDIVAYAEEQNLQVTESDITKYSINKTEAPQIKYKEVNLVAHRITERIYFNITVNNVNSAAGAPKCRITNLSGGYFFNEKVKHSVIVHHEFTISKRMMLKSNTKSALIATSIVTFGPHFITKANYENEHNLQMNFTITNGDSHIINDVVNDYMSSFHDGLQQTHTVDYSITLPLTIGNGDGPFNPDLDEWEDVEVILPL